MKSPCYNMSLTRLTRILVSLVLTTLLLLAIVQQYRIYRNTQAVRYFTDFESITAGQHIHDVFNRFACVGEIADEDSLPTHVGGLTEYQSGLPVRLVTQNFQDVSSKVIAPETPLIWYKWYYYTEFGVRWIAVARIAGPVHMNPMFGFIVAKRRSFPFNEFYPLPIRS